MTSDTTTNTVLEPPTENEISYGMFITGLPREIIIFMLTKYKELNSTTKYTHEKIQAIVQFETENKFGLNSCAHIKKPQRN